MLFQPTGIRVSRANHRVHWDEHLRNSLLIAVVWAVLLWMFALFIREMGWFQVWIDQDTSFVVAPERISAPYEIAGYFNAPWGLVLMYPINLLGNLEIAVLIQLVIYFVCLTLLIYKLGGNRRMLWLVLLSPFAFDTALETNVDWIVALGLVVPPILSGPLLAVKPQTAFGYVFSFTWKQLLYAVLIGSVVVLASVIVWGPWIEDLYFSTQTDGVGENVNLAPMSFLPIWVSLAIGGVLLYFAVARRDVFFGVTAGLFLTPYIAAYSVLIPFTVMATRWKRACMLISGTIWLMVGLFIIGS